MDPNEIVFDAASTDEGDGADAGGQDDICLGNVEVRFCPVGRAQQHENTTPPPTQRAACSFRAPSAAPFAQRAPGR